DRYGSPFLLGTYPRGDKESRNVMERAFALAVKLGGLVISEDTKVELARAEGTSATGQAYEQFIKLCHAEMSKLVLGQTLSAEASPTGELGGGTAKMQSGVRDDIRIFDATLLSETLRDQLFHQFIGINGIGGGVPKIVFGSASADDVRTTVNLLTAIRETDVEVTDEAITNLSERTGLSLQRRQSAPAGPGGFSVRPFSADLPRSRHASARLSQSARDGAADLAPLLRSFPDAVATIIEDSNSAPECQERITALYADTDRRRTAALLADALAVHAALGAARVRSDDG
ncbi:MAG: DUF935 family protein, partial [Lentisphaerae bacterium]|nr:DUF935 family protein [Lentisphaerota bacterium]